MLSMELDRDAILGIIKQRLIQATLYRDDKRLLARKVRDSDSEAKLFAAEQVEDEIKSILGDIDAKEQEVKTNPT